MVRHLEYSRDYKFIILMPVGPSSSMTGLRDTIESIKAYADPETLLFLIDDTKDGLEREDLTGDLPISIYRFGKPQGYSVRGRLYINLSQAIDLILELYRFEILLRMDDDALMTGPAPFADAKKAFDADATLGSLGSHRYTCTGARRDFIPVRRRIAFETSLPMLLAKPALARNLRRIRSHALRNGFELGEHSLGAACFYSRAALETMKHEGLLGRESLRTTRLCDDQLFGMLIYAAGFRSGDFAGENQPLGLSWQGLPADPDILIALGKKIVHSVKPHGGQSEAEVRARFQRHRNTTPLLKLVD